MSGRAVAAAFTRPLDLSRKDAFASVAVRRVPMEALGAEQANEYAKKLLALGYISGSEAQPLAATGGDRPGMTEGAWNNLGLYEREVVKDRTAAREAFQKSLALRPGYHSPMYNLAILERESGRLPEAEDWLFKALDAGHADPEGTIHNWALVYRTDSRDVAAERRLLERRSEERRVGKEGGRG